MRSFGRVLGCFVPFLAVQWGCQMSAQSGDTAAQGKQNAVVAYLSAEGDSTLREALQSEVRVAAKERGFDVITRRISTPEQVLNGLDEVAAQGAKGVLLGTSDPRLGPAILLKAEQYGLKLVSVEERLLDDQGQILKSTPFIGMNAPRAGTLAAQALITEMKSRSWKPESVSLFVVVRNTHPVSIAKTEAVIRALQGMGVPPVHIFRASVTTQDRATAEAVASRLLPRLEKSGRWLVAGPNDATVLGALDALQKAGVKQDQLIGVGIGGALPQPELGFVASVPVPTKQLGERAAEALISWVKDGKAPQAEVLVEGPSSGQ